MKMKPHLKTEEKVHVAKFIEVASHLDFSLISNIVLAYSNMHTSVVT
jgi:hypothetical protein